MKRLLRHLFPPSSRRLFPEASLSRIAEAVAAGERRHRGEVCFAVEAALPARAVLRGMQARERAHEAFSRLRVWDTAANNGVLIHLLLADHRIEIVADRGLEGLVSDEQWRGVCLLMEERLKAGEAEDAAIAGVAAVSDLLAAHFPRAADEADENELPDRPHLLG
ncbi:TPM domain-containing protein [Luteimonas aquatica]|uniref:TPM domain-containing protein n=1 Tax=Luteimonas aquatica TaxID=450364 RepID=UPI001F5789ED|nr:TPM domain-containing protein [Luteimonas aquatica]